MFDRYVLGSSSIDVNARITEQRAPTDASVRLLKEMEAEARAKMLASVRLEGNGFKGVAHRYDDVLNGDTVFIVQFEVNGERKKVEHCVAAQEGRQEIAAALVEKVGRVIAASLLYQAFAKIRL